MHDLVIWVLIGFVIFAALGAAILFAPECAADMPKGPTIGSVFKIAGC